MKDTEPGRAEREYELRIRWQPAGGAGPRLWLRDSRDDGSPWLAFQDSDTLLRHLWTLLDDHPGLR